MNKESSTEFIEKRYPVLKAVLDYCIRRLEAFVAILLVSGGLTVYQHHANKSQIWTQTGDHFQDLLQMQQSNILPRLDALEKKQKKGK